MLDSKLIDNIRSAYSLLKPNCNISDELTLALGRNDVSAFTEYINTPPTNANLLICACKYNADRIVQWICHNTKNTVDDKDALGNTALHYSAEAGHVKCTKILLDANANQRISNNKGIYAIHYAAYRGRLPVLQLMLQKDPQLHKVKDSSDRTLLMLAAFRGRTQVVSLLLSKSQVRLRDAAGYTALMYAALTGRMAICQELLEYSSDSPSLIKEAMEAAEDAGYYELASILQGRESTPITSPSKKITKTNSVLTAIRPPPIPSSPKTQPLKGLGIAVPDKPTQGKRRITPHVESKPTVPPPSPSIQSRLKDTLSLASLKLLDTRPSPKKQTPFFHSPEKAKPPRIQPYWAMFAHILTLWMPNIVLRKLFNLDTSEKRQDWREKVALCCIILFVTFLTVLISLGLSSIFCHPVESMSLQTLHKRHGLGAKQQYVVVRGRIYDVSNPQIAQQLGINRDQVGTDVSGMFAPFPEESRKCKHWPQGQTSQSCFSVLEQDSECRASKQQWDTLRSARTNKWVIYQWPDIAKNSSDHLFVYNEYVFSLKRYLAHIPEDTYFGSNLTRHLRQLVGTDGTLTVARDPRLSELVPCLHSQMRLGRIEGNTVGCVITSGITLAATTILNAMLLVKLVCAVLFDWAFTLQLSKITRHFTSATPMLEAPRVPHVLVTVTCFNENEATIRATLDSIAATNYARTRKILLVIADGSVPIEDGSRTTPEILRALLVHQYPQSPALPYHSVGEGPRAYNAAQVIPGAYLSTSGVAVPCILIIKVGTHHERTQPRPGNRGKRDSHLIILRWLQNALLNNHLTPLEFELSRAALRLSGMNPDQFEYLMVVDADTALDPECLARLVAAMERDAGIMGLCGETKIANKCESWVTRIQVYEYYISHHLSKAFESLWGGVTCLPGCCSMFRVFGRKSNLIVPLLVVPEVIDAYSSTNTHTLHQKNLLLLGEDRYLTTLLLRTFPSRKLIYVPRAICRTTVPGTFRVLLSQRRRWINSTIHNLLELVLVRDLCGTFCCSMQFLVLMDLLGNVVLPSSVVFFYYLIIAQCIGHPVALPLLLMTLAFVLQGAMIILTTQRVGYIYWMVLYILAIPIWNLVMPVYAFWRFDDFSWGRTRGKRTDQPQDFITDTERLALEPIPMKRWKDWVSDHAPENPDWCDQLAAGSILAKVAP